MATQKRTLFFSDQLQSIIGPQGFPPVFEDAKVERLACVEPMEPSLTKRVNVLGDRYRAIIESCRIQKYLTDDEMKRVATVMGGPWNEHSSKIRDIHKRVAALGAPGDAELSSKLKSMDFPTLVAMVEHIESRWCAPVPVERSEFKLATARSYVPNSPQHLLMLAGSGIMPSREKCLAALDQLERMTLTRERCPLAHEVLLDLSNSMLPSQAACEAAFKEISR
jgi:hypothetical protein